MFPPNFDSSLWDDDELAIWQSFGYRCIVCEHWGDTLHEIIPKSKTKDWRAEGNRVVICKWCHFKIHKEGCSTWRSKLEIRRDAALRKYEHSQ